MFYFETCMNQISINIIKLYKNSKILYHNISFICVIILLKSYVYWSLLIPSNSFLFIYLKKKLIDFYANITEKLSSQL